MPLLIRFSTRLKAHHCELLLLDSRMQQVIDTAEKYGRKVAFVGLSMTETRALPKS